MRLDTGLTVVIPTRNRPGMTCDLLKHLRLVLGWSCPIIVIDQSDDSGANLAERINQERIEGIDHVVHTMRGTSCARNEGARRAATEWLLFLDDDVWPARGYWQRLQEGIALHSWVDALALGLGDATQWATYRRELNELSTYTYAQYSRHKYPEHWDGVTYLTSSVWGTLESMTIGIASGNFAIRRKAFMDVGGFDENIRGLGDDRELGLRLWWYGYRVYHYPSAVAFHLRNTEGGLRTKKHVRLRDKLTHPHPPASYLYFYMKWFPGLPTRQMIGRHLRTKMFHPRFPLVAYQLYLSVKEARKLIEQGPRYISEAPPKIREAD